MNSLLRSVILVLCSAVISACAMTPQTYVDPHYHNASYDSIQRLAQPIPVKIEAQFQRNSEPLPAADAELLGHVERTLRASGVFIPSSGANTEANIGVTANNIADLDSARAKGFKTGFTFGGAGSMVDDNYEFTFSYRNAEGSKSDFSCKHAIHTAIGRTEQPVGLKPTTLADAFGRVVEDSVLNFIKDLQDAGLALNK